MKAVYGPRGGDVGEHLADRYGVEVKAVTPLDHGVFRVALAGGGDWVARVFLPGRTASRVHHDANLLAWLEEQSIRAERLATVDAVSDLNGFPVLVTWYIEGRQPGKTKRDLVAVADMLGRLQVARTPAGLLEGGSLHHVPGYEGLPAQDLRLARDLLDDIAPDQPGRARDAVSALREALAEADELRDLPVALIHPDPALVNQILDSDRMVHLIDWAGAGVGPRLYPIAQVLDQSATARGYDPGRLNAAVAAYSRHVTLTEVEVARLGAASRIRILWLAAWNVWTQIARGRQLQGGEWWLARAVLSQGRTAPEIEQAFSRV